MNAEQATLRGKTIEQIIEHLAKEKGYPERKLDHDEYIGVLREAHTIKYGSDKDDAPRHDNGGILEDEYKKGGQVKIGTVFHIDTDRVNQYEGTRVVDDVRVAETPKKGAKKVLVFSPYLNATVLVDRSDLKVKEYNLDYDKIRTKLLAMPHKKFADDAAYILSGDLDKVLWRSESVEGRAQMVEQVIKALKEDPQRLDDVFGKNFKDGGELGSHAESEEEYFLLF